MIVVDRWTGADASLSALLADYHGRTEHEKLLGREPAPDDPAPTSALPERHRREVDDPATAFERDVVLVARADDSTLSGCVVLTPGPSPEVKRLWVADGARRRGVATALLDAAIRAATDRGDPEVRLSVWHWRTGAIALYRRSGFRPVPSWDDRPGLDCFVRSLR